MAHATAIKAIGRLKREGLVTARPYRGVFLTEAGQELAARVRARHRVVVRLLVALGVPVADAEADAEGIEHHVSEGHARRLRPFPVQRTVTAPTKPGRALRPRWRC